MLFYYKENISSCKIVEEEWSVWFRPFMTFSACVTYIRFHHRPIIGFIITLVCMPQYIDIRNRLQWLDWIGVFPHSGVLIYYSAAVLGNTLFCIESEHHPKLLSMLSNSIICYFFSVYWRILTAFKDHRNKELQTIPKYKLITTVNNDIKWSLKYHTYSVTNLWASSIFTAVILWQWQEWNWHPPPPKVQALSPLEVK